MAKYRGRCRCGGILIIDEKTKTTSHSLPMCKEYSDIVTPAVKQGKAKVSYFREKKR